MAIGLHVRSADLSEPEGPVEALFQRNPIRIMFGDGARRQLHESFPTWPGTEASFCPISYEEPSPVLLVGSRPETLEFKDDAGHVDSMSPVNRTLVQHCFVELKTAVLYSSLERKERLKATYMISHSISVIPTSTRCL